jgi:ELWxxDGT repeat protein
MYEKLPPIERVHAASRPVPLRSRPAVRRRRLDIEPLERRDLPAAATASLLKDIAAGAGASTPALFTAVGSTMFFAANDGAHGNSLWKSDGTSAGTMLVKYGSLGGPSDPNNLVNVNGTLYFAAGDPTHGQELWRSDGTSSGTQLVKDIRPGSANSLLQYLTNVNGTLFFTEDDGVHGNELWKSNGTSAGTVLVCEIKTGGSGSSDPKYLTNVNGTLFFSAAQATGKRELFKSNGTSAGTVLVYDFANTQNSYLGKLTAAGNNLFFTAQQDSAQGVELWQSNGTSAGTTVFDLDPVPLQGSNPHSLVNVNGTLYFEADNGTDGPQLWKSTGGSPVMISNLQFGPLITFFPANTTNVNGTLFFTAHDASHGNNLWKSNGTSAGTFMVKDIAPGAAEYDILNLTAVGRNLYFVTSEGTAGFEMWMSDGTSTGTSLVANIGPGSSDANITQVGATSSLLFFGANDGAHGYEPWVARLPNNAPVLDASKSPALYSVKPNSGVPVGKVGTLVDALVHLSGSLKNVTDADPGALTGIAVTKVDTTHGTWYYSLNNGTTWLALAASTTKVKLLAADGQTRLYFKPTAGFTGSIASAVTFRAWDRTTGINGGTADVTLAGGATAFSKYGDTASISVM